MNNFNDLIVSGVTEYIKSCIGRVQNRDQLGYKLEVVKTKLVTPSNVAIGELQRTGESSVYELLVTTRVTDPKGVPTDTKSSILIPRQINNIFVLKGKIRVPTQTLEGAPDCRIYSDYIVVNSRLKISLNKDYVISTYDKDGNELIIDHTQDLSEFKEYLTLSDDEQIKFSIKLDKDFPKILTHESIMELIEFGPDRDKDFIVDKRVSTVYDSLLSSLWSRSTLRKVVNGMARKFFANKTIYLKDIQNALVNFFYGSDKASKTSIDVPTISNPLAFDSNRYKIKLSSSVAYNETLSDIIDIVNTPENANVNIINELNYCISIEGDILMIKCYELDGTKKKMRYLDYLNSRVLKSEYYDYDNNRIIESDSYEFKYRMRIHKVAPSELHKYYDGLLVEPKPDDKLSVTTRRIPLINMSDTVRLGMCTSMIRQSVELANPEKPLISAGNDEDDIDAASQVTKYNGKFEGVVLDIVNDTIIIKSNDLMLPFEINQPTLGNNNSVITFVPAVKKGDKVKPGDKLIVPRVLKKGSYDVGINAACLYMNYLGYTHEDGIVISESFARRLRSYELINLTAYIKPSDQITSILSIGKSIRTGDSLMERLVIPNYSKSTQEALGAEILNKPLNNKKAKSTLVPNNIELGYLLEVRIDKGPQQLTDPQSKNLIEHYLEGPKDEDYKMIPEEYKIAKLRPSDVPPTCAYAITFQILRVKDAMIGTKLCNRYGSKGQVSLVVPDELMPRTVDADGNTLRVAEIIMTPASVVARKNPSQSVESLISNIIYKIYAECVKRINAGDIDGAKKYTIDLYGTRFMKMKDDDFVDLVLKGPRAMSFDTGSYFKYSTEKMIELKKQYGADDTYDIYAPDVLIAETSQGLKAFNPESVDKSKLKDYHVHELGWIEEPAVFGDNYFLKLYHSADYVGKVTPQEFDFDAPVWRRGNYRRGAGQKIGEMELWVLTAYGEQRFVIDDNEDFNLFQYRFLNELLMAGYCLVDNDNIPIMSNYRQSIQKLRDHLLNSK